MPKSASGIAALHTRAGAAVADHRPGGAITGPVVRSQDFQDDRPAAWGGLALAGSSDRPSSLGLRGGVGGAVPTANFVFFDRRQSVHTAAARRLKTGCITQTSPRHDLCDRSRGNSSKTSRAASDHSFEAEQPIQSVPLVALGIQASSDRVRTPSRSAEFY